MLAMAVRGFLMVVVRMLLMVVVQVLLMVVVHMLLSVDVPIFEAVLARMSMLVTVIMRVPMLVLLRPRGGVRSRAGQAGVGTDGNGFLAHERYSTPWGYYRVKYANQENPMKIGELAKAAGTTVETVRYYEKEGLLPAPERGANNYRSYGPVHAERLRLIRNCRALDMTQDEIRAILSLADSHAADCGPINEIFQDHIRHVDERIAELRQLKSQLSALRQRCLSARPHAEDCGILHGLAEMQVEERPERHTHLG
jgi:Cd(II)/Pb(II)-responsive transcriptional regulator